MARERRLNVFNSDRVYNLNLIARQDEDDYIEVTKDNEQDIEKEMEELRGISKRYNITNDSVYLVNQEREGNNTVNEKVVRHGGQVYYYTNTLVPERMIDKISKSPQTEVIYQGKSEYEEEDIRNIQLSFMATKVTINIPIVLPDDNPYDVLFSLHPLRYNIDRVRLVFPELNSIREDQEPYYFLYKGKYHLKSNYKYECFRHIREPLSTWKMNIVLVCDTQQDKDKVYEMVVENNERFQRREENKNIGSGGSNSVK